MIYDKLENILIYTGTNRNLDTAIDYIATHDLNALPMGRTTVDGDNVYINVMDAEAAPAEARSFEIHKNYMDIQIDLAGTEVIEIGDVDAMTVENYKEDTDFGNASCHPLTSCTMGRGNFIVCMPSEPHKPGILFSEETKTLKKCVFKVHK